ncbi:MAG TPA: hypothetical protein VFJ05_06290 [Nitrososphaeraceae archaeon]|nr:hypothetical protein [Nitrososphaeraceae archaeon]
MRARIIILPLVAVILLLVTALLQNLPMIYADNLENQQPINDMSDQVATLSTSPPPNAAQQQQQLQQLTQQTQQPFQPPPQTLIPPYNTISDNDNTANMGISNSNPRSSIKVTSVDQQVPPFTSVPISTSSPTTSPSQNDRSQATNYSGNDHQSIPNLVVNGGSPVTLDGSQSYDPDGNQITFAWTQTAGPSVIISDANTSKAKFTAPNLDNDKIMLFKLTVTDENGLSDSGIVQVTVIPSTSPSLGSSMN